MVDALLETLKAHEQLFWLLGFTSLALFVGTALIIPWLVIRLPTDFFARKRPGRGRLRRRHPLVAILLVIIRNVFGAVLLVAGFVMLFVPGQGLLTILIGIALVDFPGKHALFERMLRSRRIFDAANAVRRWAGKQEFHPFDHGASPMKRGEHAR